jgi:PAS domain S-box-containing protein
VAERAYSSGSVVINRLPSLPDAVWAKVLDSSRRAVLTALSSVQASPDIDFDHLTRLAASIFKVPIAVLSVVDYDREWFKSTIGLAEGFSGTLVEQSFCAYTIAEEDKKAFVVRDMGADERFASHPFVQGEPKIRFYAGAPVVVQGQNIASLCVMSTEPQPNVTLAQIQQLTDLAALAGSLFELKEEASVRTRTAEALIQEEWRHALTLEAGKVGSWVWDVRSGEVVVNDILRRMYQFGPDEKITARKLYDAVIPEDQPLLLQALRNASGGRYDYVGEYRVRNSGAWLMARGRVFQHNEQGRPLVIMGINLDVTETKQTSENTRILLRELNHRVKNTLAMIQSLARQTLKRSPDPKAFIDAFSGRLQTLTDAHTLLSNRDWSGIGLQELVDLQVAGIAPRISQLEVSGQDLQLPPDHALGLGIILHELASNALKHGAFSVPHGQVSLRWSETKEAGRRICLIWKEANGPSVAPPQEYGLGGKLIERSLAKVIDSKVELSFPADGVMARISFPLGIESQGLV